MYLFFQMKTKDQVSGRVNQENVCTRVVSASVGASALGSHVCWNDAEPRPFVPYENG